MLTPSTRPTAGASPGGTRSPFAGRRVHLLAGLELPPGHAGPLFDEEIWDFTGVRGAPVQLKPGELRFDFAAIDHAPWRTVAREFVVAFLCPHLPQVALLPLAHRTPRNLRTCQNRSTRLTTWLQWLTACGVTSLNEVTQEHCDRYLRDRQSAGLAPASVFNDVLAVKDLARYGELFSTDRYRRGFEPWHRAPAATVAGFSPRGENRTLRVPDPLLAPALHAGLYLIETIGPQLLTLLAQRQAAPHAGDAGTYGPHDRRTATLGLLDRYVREDQPLPSVDERYVEVRLSNGWSADDPLLRVNFAELARVLGGSKQFHEDDIDAIRGPVTDAVAAVGSAPAWARDGEPVERADGAGRTPWTVPLTRRQVDELGGTVFNASLFVTAALTGMRAGELMELTTASLIPPRELADGLVRFALAGRRIKGETWGGVRDEWVVIQAAYCAVELAARLRGRDLDSVKAPTPSGRDAALVFGRFAFVPRFDSFRRWVNGPAGARLGLRPIPDGRINARMLRRTLALELAHRPYGLLAARTHLKHISVATTEGYAARPGGSQGQFHAEVAAEHTRRQLDLATTVLRDYQAGILPAGPGARPLITALQHIDDHTASEPADRSPTTAPATVLPAQRHLELMLKKRAATLHAGPANYCWFTDPAQALCLKLAGTPASTTPLIGLCDAARCPQATFHPQHRPVWEAAAHTTAVFLGNPRVPAAERGRLAAEHARTLRVLDAIDDAIAGHTSSDSSGSSESGANGPSEARS